MHCNLAHFLRNNISVGNFAYLSHTLQYAFKYQHMFAQQTRQAESLPLASDIKNLPPADKVKSLELVIRRTEPWLPRRRSFISESSKHILSECGLNNATDIHASYFVDIMCSKVKYLKERGYIPEEVNVTRHLIDEIKDVQLSFDPYQFNDNTRLGTIRYFIVSAYINQLLEMSDEENHLLLRSENARILKRSLADIYECHQILTNEIGITQKKLQANTFLLGADSENIRNFLNMKTIGGIDARYIARKQPILLNRSNIAVNIKAIMKHIRAFGINESQIKRKPNIFLLAPQKVLERLTKISLNEELQVYLKMDRALDMVTSFERILNRLQSLKYLPTRKRITFNALVQPNDDIFIRQATLGLQKFKTEEYSEYFAEIFGKSPEEIKAAILEHPHGVVIPIFQMSKTLHFLLDQGFTNEEIFKNFYILNYPLEKIKKSLENIRDEENIRERFNMDVNTLSSLQRLKLCGILMEVDHNFSGDGCWPDTDALLEDSALYEDDLRDMIKSGKKRTLYRNKIGFKPQLKD